ncbi:Hsp33 family molecular chaperone HslO [Fervidobacterium thailandense]|uniref:33 kDa chaperonin n=1 Tax=Fervidobacterium thailandense TaxID=1008305 RepID=A0A1E3G562_9BACT|nr:Hsp33 family molecular chaperone HslO [Fervidobacterium thailandense]ODN31282.1 molecular chaperone Hsp33 [Fervidobacterium thailandense]
MGKIIYGTAYAGKLRFSLLEGTDIVEVARKQHGLSYLPTVVLGRLLVGAGLVCPWLSEKETITFVLSGDGPAGTVSAQSNSRYTVRGYITNKNFELERNELGKFDVRSAVGSGSLTVVRDVGLRNPLISKVPIVSGEIAEDIAYYYTVSEQIPSAFALGVLMNKEGVVKAGGVAIQVLDKSIDEKALAHVENSLKGFSVTSALGNYTLEELAERLLGTWDLIIETAEVKFHCGCSKEKARDALTVLSEDDLLGLIAEGRAEVTCKWCSSVYVFEKDELVQLLKEEF